MKKKIFLFIMAALLWCTAFVMAADPEVTSLYNSARKDYNEGRAAQAIEKFEQVLQRDPSFVPAYNDLGCTYQDVGSYEKSIEVFNRGLARKPQDAIMLFNLGKTYELSGVHGKASDAYERALAADPSFSRARIMICEYYLATRNYQKARDHAQVLVDGESGNIIFGKLLIDALRGSGDYERARTECSRLLSIDPSNSEIKELMKSLDRPGPGSIPGVADPSPSASPRAPSSGSGSTVIIVMGIIVGIAALLGSVAFYYRKEPANPVRVRSAYGEREPDRLRQEGAYQERPHQERSNQDRSYQDRSYQERLHQERSNQDRSYQERPYQEKMPPARVPTSDDRAAATVELPAIRTPGQKAAASAPSEASRCWKLQNCRDDMRRTCVAFKEGGNCWSYEKTPCCNKDRALCVLCPFYSYRLQKAQKQSSGEYREVAIQGNSAGLLENLSNPQMALLKEISEALSSSNELEELGKNFLQKMGEAILCENGALFLVNREKELLYLVSSHNCSAFPLKQIPFSAYIYSWIRENQFPMTFQKARRDKNWGNVFPVMDEMELFQNFELIVPLLEQKEKLMGIILFGRKKTRAPYQPAETGLINLASGMIAVTLEKARAYKLAVFDGLTGLYVVRYFREKLSEELKAPRSLLQGCSLIMTDIDHFKKFNDTYGHQQGDAVLKEVARLIKTSLRNNDIAARYGGEEMSVIFPATERQVALEVAERIRRVIESTPFPGLPPDVRVTISLGVAAYPRDAQNPEELIKKADEALYRAKHSGRNRTCTA